MFAFVRERVKMPPLSYKSIQATGIAKSISTVTVIPARSGEDKHD